MPEAMEGQPRRMNITATDPYAEAFDQYWQSGWRGVLPLPYRQKKDPPTGRTGYQGTEPSYPDCYAWSEDGPHNICLRMPPNAVGIDVDHYDGRGGGNTLAALVAKHGPLPPTWLSTSRDDGISGIRFYAIPPGTVLPTKLPGIEFIQRHHRYAVVWPSVHPSGSTYRWVDETDPANTSGVPNLGLLPELPAAWIGGLQTTQAEHAKQDVGDMAASLIMLGLPDGEPCPHIRQGAGKAVEGGDRHDSYNEAVLAVVGAGRRGCPGARGVLARLRQAFISEVVGDDSRTMGEAGAEWERSIRGAIAIVAGDPQGNGCPDDALAAYLASIDDDTDNTVANDGETSELEQSDPYMELVKRKAAELRVVTDARDLNAARDAATLPPLAGINLADFLAQPDDPITYRVDGLWPAEGRTLLVAAAKAGKTTILSRNLLGCLTAGGDFLGQFEVQPVAGTVVYLNLEVGEQTLRAWMRKAGIGNPDKLIVVNLRGRVGSLNLSSAHGRARFADFLAAHGAEVVVADPLAPLLAAHDLVEDSNSDVAKFFEWWGASLAEAGVRDDLIAHHAGHAGQRSRGASRLLDEPDAVWTITKAQAQVEDDDILAGNDRRFLTCYGRNVELPESALDFDPATGLVSILDGSGSELRKRDKDAAYERAVVEVIRAKVADGGMPPSKRAIVKDRGNERQMSAALDRLVDRGEVMRQPLGRGNGDLYTVIAYPPEGVSPTIERHPGDTATGGVARLYKSDTSDRCSDAPTPATLLDELIRCPDCGIQHHRATSCRNCQATT